MCEVPPSVKNPNNRQPFDVQQNKYNTERFHNHEDGILNIGYAAPGPELLEHCAANFSKATKHFLKKDAIDHDVFRYGETTGNPSVRVNVARFLSENYGTLVDHRDLVMTGGASHAIHLVLTSLIDMDGVIFIDELTYKNILAVVNNFDRMQIVIVPWRDNQPDIPAFNALVEQYKFKSRTKLFWGMYYAMPIYHNPSTVCFTEDVCERLLDLSKKHNLLIACDDVQATLPCRTEMPLKRLYAYDNDPDSPGTIISIGSFSKTLAPSIRVGWMECPPRCVEAFNNCGGLIGGGGICTYSSGIMSSLIELGLAQQQLVIYQTAFKERMSLACKLLHENLPANCYFNEPAGGILIWVRMPEHCDADEFLHKIIRNGFRISISYPTCETLTIAIPILCNALREFCNSE